MTIKTKLVKSYLIKEGFSSSFVYGKRRLLRNNTFSRYSQIGY